jgi:hypothetical protein
MLERFEHAISGVSDAPNRALLNRLALHFALVHVRENIGDWALVVTTGALSCLPYRSWAVFCV